VNAERPLPVRDSNHRRDRTGNHNLEVVTEIQMTSSVVETATLLKD